MWTSLEGNLCRSEDVRLLLLRRNLWSGSWFSLRVFTCCEVLKGEERLFLLVQWIWWGKGCKSSKGVSRAEWLFFMFNSIEFVVGLGRYTMSSSIADGWQTSQCWASIVITPPSPPIFFILHFLYIYFLSHYISG